MSGHCISHRMDGILVTFLFVSSVLCPVFGAAADARVIDVKPNYGSLNGGTKITLSGENFAESQFNFGEGNENLGNKVRLVSNTRSYECDIHPNGCHQSQLECYTRAMPEDNYYVRVEVDGEAVAENQHCYRSGGTCRFSTVNWRTPTIDSLIPNSGDPGTVVTFSGKIMTSRVFSTDKTSSNGREDRIRRVYLGGENCDMRVNEFTDELYGVALNGDGTSDYGYVKCRHDGKKIGNVNASILIEGEWGRTKPSVSAYDVSKDDQIYMFQTFPVITGISPSVGSIEGGTNLTISGRYFDVYQSAGAAKIHVGGMTCGDVSIVSETEIVCSTPPAPDEVVEYYVGNRGLTVDLWNGTDSYRNLESIEDVRNYSREADNYHSMWTDGAGFAESEIDPELVEYGFELSEFDRYVDRMEGYFVPPHTGNYTFHLKSDDGAKVYLSEDSDPQHRTEILNCSLYCPTADVYPETQESETLQLEGKKPYYFEVFHGDYGGNGFLKFGVKVHQTSLNAAQTDKAKNEKQKIRISSTQTLDTQEIVLSNWPGSEGSGSAVSEVQQVTVTYTDPSAGAFKLSLNGALTARIALDADGSTVQEALNRMPGLPYDAITMVTKSQSTYDITFNSALGDVNLLEFSAHPEQSATGSVATLTPGVSDLSALQLAIDGVPSPFIPSDPTADEVDNAVTEIFTARCPKDIDGTHPEFDDKVKFFIDFEDAELTSRWRWGTHTFQDVAFCGRGSLKNPTTLFNGNTDGLALLLLALYRKMCFAYKGTYTDRIRVRYEYTEDRDVRARTQSFDYDFLDDGEWHFDCVNIYDWVASSSPDGSNYKLTWVRVTSQENALVDNILLVKDEFSSLMPDDRIADVPYERLLPPLGGLMEDVVVNQTSHGTYDVTLMPYHCLHGLPLIGLNNAQVASGDLLGENVTYNVSSPHVNASVSVVRHVTASPPVGGAFDVTFHGQTVTVNATAGENELQGLLETIAAVGDVEVSRDGGCTGYDYHIEWLTVGGDQDLAMVDGSDLTGNDMGIEASEIEAGGIMHDIIPGEMIFSVHTVPQVVLEYEGIAAKCGIDDCGFNWAEEATPIITAVTPTSGSSGAPVTIAGTGFGTNENDTVVLFGDVSCDVSAVTDTEIVCTPQVGPVGPANITLRVAGKGFASHGGSRHAFEFTAEISSISPTSVEIGGGAILTINGYGFTEDSAVTIGSENCEVLFMDYTAIECVIPQIANASDEGNTFSVQVETSDDILVSRTGLIYAGGLALTEAQLNTSQAHVLGGTAVKLTPGSDFMSNITNDSALTVTINGEAAEFDTDGVDINITLPANPPGVYPLELTYSSSRIYVEEGLLDITYTLLVTAVSPSQGSYMGGTRLTLMGQGFPDNDTSDVSVTLGNNTGCVVETVNETAIVCETQSAVIEHVVQNNGVHPVRGEGFAWKPSVVEIEVGDSVRWVWRVPAGVTGVHMLVQQTATAWDDQRAEDGFASGDVPTSQGTFVKQFTSPGEYFYNSGQVLTFGDHVMKGTVKVRERSSREVRVNVTVGEYEAQYEAVGSIALGTDCPHGSDSFENCTSDVIISAGDDDVFTFDWSTCHTPVVLSIEPQELNVTDDITITGLGFGDQICQHSILLGTHECVVSSVNSTAITCNVNAASSVPVYTALPVSLSVSNLGNAVINISQPEDGSVTLKPFWNSLSRSVGSLQGGTVVVVSGGGFATDGTLRVLIANNEATVLSSTSSSIEFSTPAGPEGIYTVEVLTSVAGQVVPVTCTAESETACEFEYSQEVTPVITGYNYTGLDDNNTITVVFSYQFIDNNDNSSETTSPTVQRRRRSLLGSDDVIVMVGDKQCVVSAVTSSEITCSLTEPPAGSLDVSVTISSLGSATAGDNQVLSLVVQGSVIGVVPDTGSVSGGTVLIINGTGFVEGVTSVAIGGAPCDVLSVSFVQVTCRTSVGTGEQDLVVTVNGQPVGEPVSYTYSLSATPTVTAVSPQIVTGQTTLTISGTSLDASNTIVTIGSENCLDLAGSSGQLTCTFTPEISGNFSITTLVYNLGFASVVETVSITVTSEVSSAAPTRGSFGGGHTVIITGSGFPASQQASPSVTLCDLECDVINVTATEITITTPPHPGSGEIACDLSVTIDGTEHALSDAYTYSDSLTPAVTDVSPRRAGTGGGTLLTLTTDNLGNDASGLLVTIAGVECEVQSIDGDNVTCRTGASSVTTPTHVRISVGNGQSPEYDNSAFEYIDVWSSPWTWGGDTPPVEGDLVVISEGQTILLDTDTPILKMLIIQGGTLKFDTTRDIHLQAEYILVTNGGRFMIGTEEEPYEREALIEIHGNVRATELPIYGAKVLAVRDGYLGLFGKPIPHTWSYLAETAEAGSNTITLELAATGWNVGDLIVLPSTGDRHSQRENEIFTITAKSDDELTLTLNTTLEYDHIVIDTEVDGHAIQMKGEVGLLSRNIKIQGSNDAAWHVHIEACPEGFDTGEFVVQTCFQGRFGDELGADGYGAMILLHASQPDRDLITAHIQYVELNYVGQELRLGRYPIHFHLNGDMSGSYVRGVAIHQSYNRAVNVHGTHNLIIEHNVIYDIRGGAFFFEDGIETGNVLQYNLAVFVRSSTSLLNDDITPAAIWITNPNNTIEHNNAAGGTHFGFWYRMHTHPDGPSFTTSVCPKHVPLGVFNNNTVHSQGWFGLWIFQDYFPKEDGSCSSDAPSQQAVFTYLHAWHCEKGAEWVDVTDLKFDHFTMINNEKAGIEMKMIRDSQRRFLSSGSVISNALIVAHHPDDPVYTAKCTTRGVILPFDSGLTVDGVTFINFNRESCTAFGVTKIDGKCGLGCGGYNYHTRGLEFIETTNRMAWRWEHEGAFVDLDGSLTRITNGKLVPTSGVLPAVCEPADDSTGFNVQEASSVCAAEVEFVRFAFNLPSPESLRYKDARFIVNSDTSRVATAPFLAKRLTHTEGWMAMLPMATSYTLEFVDAEHITNISYASKYYDLAPSSWVIMKSQVDLEPDRVFVKRGDSRDGSVNPLDYDNNVDGDWYYDSQNNKVSYLVSGRTSVRKKRNMEAEFDDLIDSAIDFQAYKCYYPDCIVPVIGGGDQIPVDTRPANALLWSDTATWPDATLPEDNEDVIIELGRWVVVDTEELPTINNLFIYGTLEFEFTRNPDTGDYFNFLFRVKNIYIAGTGRLIAGWEDEPFLGSLDIEIRGPNDLSDRFDYPGEDDDGPVLGSKVIAVFGGLDLHGNPDVGPSWTRLSQTASAGSTEITLQDPVTWRAGDVLVVAPTGYEASDTETRVIQTVSGDGRTVTLTQALDNTHLGVVEDIPGIADDHGIGRSQYSMSAEVGLLSRNIRIKSAHSDDVSESYGPRILVSTMVNADGTFTGYARLSNVGFWRAGQEGYTAEYDPRFALSYLNTGEVNEFRPSRVTNCSFDENFSPALGAFGAEGLNVYGCVVHRTVGHAMKVWGSDNVLEGNLVTNVLWPGSYNGREESSNFDWVAGIEGTGSTGLTLIDNVVAGSERSGYSVPGDVCSDDVETQRMRGNEAHSVLTGIGIFPDYSRADCLQLKGFSIYKAYDFGIYVQSAANVRIQQVLLVDCGVGVLGLPLLPPALSHVVENKVFAVSDSVLIGHSASFSCSDDVMDLRVPNMAFSGQGRSFRVNSKGRVGLAFPLFLSAPNSAPRKPWIGSMSYPTIGGLMTVTDTHFASFGPNPCDSDSRHFAFATNPESHDASHPIETRGLSLADVDYGSKVFVHRPSLGEVNPSDCVDMDCDGHKKVLLKDLDSTFFTAGASGAMIPQSEFEWNGDPRRGVGDYRIPRAMLTDSAGNRLPNIPDDVYNHIGITRNDDCAYHEAWQAYECHGLQYEMLIIESMDADTEDRRLSPVAIRSHSQRYLDLINGPQDHGWCDGYTCQQRISTFYALVATSEGYDIFFSSTNPQRLRLRLLNTEAEEKVHLAVYYPTRSRLDVYLESSLVEPNVAGDVPTLADAVGTNAYEPETQLIHVLLAGGTFVDVVISPQVVVSFSVPAITVDEFFGENLVNNMATFLGIEQGRIKVTVIVAEGSVRRRRRSGESIVEIEISSLPTAALDQDGVAMDSVRGEVQGVSNTIVTATQLGSLNQQLGLTLSDVTIQEPLPSPADATWTTVAEMIAEGESLVQEIRVPSVLQTVQQASTGTESVGMDTVPVLHMLDDEGIRITLLGSTVSPWQLTATLVNGSGSDPDAYLVGDVTVPFTNGLASFEALAISHSGSGYMIDFTVTYPAEVNFTVRMGPFIIGTRALSGAVLDAGTTFAIDDSVEISMAFVDAGTTDIAHDIFWKGHTWECSVSLNDAANYPGELTGTSTVSVSPNGTAEFSGLTATALGFMALTFDCHTTPAGAYGFTVNTGVIGITATEDDAILSERDREVTIKFNADYDRVVGDNADWFSAFIGNYLVVNHQTAVYSNFTVSEGSILVSFVVEGPVDTIDVTVDGLWQTVQSGLTMTYNGYVVTAAAYMVVDGVNQHSDDVGDGDDDSEEKEDGSLALAIIILICVLIALVIAGLVILVIFFVKKSGKSSERGSRVDVVNHISVGTMICSTAPHDTAMPDKYQAYVRGPSRASSTASGGRRHTAPPAAHDLSPMEAEKAGGTLITFSRPSSREDNPKGMLSFGALPPAGE